MNSSMVSRLVGVSSNSVSLMQDRRILNNNGASAAKLEEPVNVGGEIKLDPPTFFLTWFHTLLQH